MKIGIQLYTKTSIIQLVFWGVTTWARNLKFALTACQTIYYIYFNTITNSQENIRYQKKWLVK